MNDFCECGAPWVKRSPESKTLVGYYSPRGHDHDDNCRNRVYVCEAGHRRNISKQNTCPACEWMGKLTCFCHPGEKVKEWPKIGAAHDAA